VDLDKNLKFEDLKSVQEGLKVEGKLIEVEEISYITMENPKMKVGIKIKNTGNYDTSHHLRKFKI
jgi:23S rRNA pseudouridine2605 synthase